MGFTLRWFFALLVLVQLAFIPRLQDGAMACFWRPTASEAFLRVREKVLRQEVMWGEESADSAESMKTAFNSLDKNGDASISWEEFSQSNVDGLKNIRELRDGPKQKQDRLEREIEVDEQAKRMLPAAPSLMRNNTGLASGAQAALGASTRSSAGTRNATPAQQPQAMRTRRPPTAPPQQPTVAGDGVNCRAILNLATTFIEDTTDHLKVAAQWAVLRNYQRLRRTGKFQGYLFTKNETWASRARAHDVFVFSDVETNSNGTPKLKPMFHQIIELSQKRCGPPVGLVFDGYANGDIIFSQSLLSTLTTLQRGWREAVANGTRKGVMLVGRRTNVDYKGEELPSDDALLHFAISKGKIFPSFAQDYFVYSRSAAGSSQDWREVPDFVVGRLAYDNWLVDHAFHDARLDLLDGTETVLAVHLTTKDGNKAGHSKGADTHWNKGLINPTTGQSIALEFAHGKTHHCPFTTRLIHQRNTTLTHERNTSREDPEIAVRVRSGATGRSLPPGARPRVPAAEATAELPAGELEAKHVYQPALLARLSGAVSLGR